MSIERFPTRQATDVSGMPVTQIPRRRRRGRQVTAKGKSRVTPRPILDASYDADRLKRKKSA